MHSCGRKTGTLWMTCGLAIGLSICLWADVALGEENPAAVTEYRQRLANLPRGDLDGRLALGQWCESRGLTEKADALYRLVLQANPNHRQAYDLLVKLSDRSGLPAERPHRMDALAREYQDGFFMKQTAHYLIVYDTGHLWADSRSSLLEGLHDRFFEQMRQAGFRPMPLGRRLVCVLFNDHADYANHAVNRDGKQITWADGYYSVRHNHAVFYNSHTSPDLVDDRGEMDRLKSRIDGLQLRAQDAANRRDDQAARQLRSQLARAKRDYQTRERNFRRRSGLSNIATTIHEAVHQVAFNSGIQKRGWTYPFWFTEGLAMAFETTNPTIAHGPRYVNRHRRDRFIKARQANQLIPLDQLISKLSVPNDVPSDRVEVIYAQAWALWHFLYNERTEQFHRFIQALNRQPSGMQDERAFAQMFAEAFGPTGVVDREMRAFIKK